MDTSSEAPSTWIFQANPSMYDIEVSLVVETSELWNCNQHSERIKPGDRVLIWISGTQAGIYAVGTVMSQPIVRSDSEQGMSYWTNPVNGFISKPRVEVRYDRILTEKPLLREYLRCDPALWELSILRQPRATNFAVSEQEWMAIETWLS